LSEVIKYETLILREIRLGGRLEVGTTGKIEAVIARRDFAEAISDDKTGGRKSVGRDQMNDVCLVSVES